MLVVVFPAGGAGFEGIIFGDSRFHVVVAGDGFGDGDAVGTELEEGGGFGAASAIVELKENVEAVGGVPDGLVAGEIAHHEEGIAVGGGGDVCGERGGSRGRGLLGEEQRGEKDEKK